jgi:PAS domain S-box-containing protein
MHTRRSNTLSIKTEANLISRKKTSQKKPDEEIHIHVPELQDYLIELEKQNEELCRIHERYNLAVSAANIGVWDWDIRKNELIWDDRMYGLYGISREDFSGAYEAWLEGVHPDDRAASHEISRQVLRSEKEYDTEFRILWPNGTVRILKAHGLVFRDSEGRPLRMTGINYDITERKWAEDEIRKLNEELNQRVQERTRKLEKAIYEVDQECAEKIRTGESLKKSEILLQKVMENMPVGVWIVDHNGKVISGNRASQEIWCGARHVDIEQYSEYKGWRVDTGKLIKPHEWGAARAVTKGEISLNEEIEIECFDGAHKFILNSAVPLINEAGNITGAIIVNQDITELKQAERKRLDDALYARSLIEASLDPLVTISSEGKIMDVNKATESATGLSRERLIGSDFADYFAEPDMARKGYQEVFSKGFVRDYPLAIRNVSGRVMEVLYNASLYRNESGEIKGILAAARDMTDHIEMEEAIHESETLYHHFFQNSVAGSFRTIYNPSTKDARRIDCNEAHARMLGYDRREDALDLDVKDIFPSDHEYEQYFHDLLEKKILRNYKLSLQRRDGKRIWVLLNASARKYQDDLIILEGTMVDISELVDAETNLKDINEQLGLLTTELITTEERERRKISIDLHDNIGQTLALTKIKLESLKQPASKDEFTIILDQIGELINQSIQQARSLMTELSPSILYELGFTEAIDWLSEQMEADYGLQIILNDDLKKLDIDEEIQVLLFRAVRELLLNVVKHASARQAYITLQTVGKNIQITVKDKGIGFDMSTVDETTKETGGFGLLSIKERIKHIGGLVEMKSGRGYGTCVTLVAPRKNPKKRRYKK